MISAILFVSFLNAWMVELFGSIQDNPILTACLQFNEKFMF